MTRTIIIDAIIFVICMYAQSRMYKKKLKEAREAAWRETELVDSIWNSYRELEADRDALKAQLARVLGASE